MNDYGSGSGSSDGSLHGEGLCSHLLTEETFTSHDVVLGKGNGINGLPGNQLFRSIINKYRPLYAKTPRNDKGSVAELVIKEIATLDPPGRFLKPMGENKCFREVPKKLAIEKTCQALREKKHCSPSQPQENEQTIALHVALTRKVSPPDYFPALDDTEPQFTPEVSGAQTEPADCVGKKPPASTVHFSGASQIYDEEQTTPKHVERFSSFTTRASAPLMSQHAKDDGNEPMDLDGTSLDPSVNEDDKSDSMPVWPLMDNDVLYGGRGRKHFHRVANQRFLDLIKYSRQEYHTSRSKKRVALGIITQWRHQNPPGRFLQQCAADNKWYEIPKYKILEKTCQALRDLKRERGVGGVRPTIADRLLDANAAAPGHQQLASPSSQLGLQPGNAAASHNMHIQPSFYLPPPSMIYGNWNVHPHGPPYPPPPPMMYGNPYVLRPAPPPHGAHPGGAEIHHGSMMYSNGFRPVPLGTTRRESSSGSSSEDAAGEQKGLECVQGSFSTYYGHGYMAHHPPQQTSLICSTSTRPPGGLPSNMHSMNYAQGFMPYSQSPAVGTDSLGGPPNSGNSNFDDSNTSAPLPPWSGPPAAQRDVAGTECRAPLATEEVKKVDEIIRPPSSSPQVSVPPASFGAQDFLHPTETPVVGMVDGASPLVSPENCSLPIASKRLLSPTAESFVQNDKEVDIPTHQSCSLAQPELHNRTARSASLFGEICTQKVNSDLILNKTTSEDGTNCPVKANHIHGGVSNDGAGEVEGCVDSLEARTFDLAGESTEAASNIDERSPCLPKRGQNGDIEAAKLLVNMDEMVRQASSSGVPVAPPGFSAHALAQSVTVKSHTRADDDPGAVQNFDHQKKSGTGPNWEPQLTFAADIAVRDNSVVDYPYHPRALQKTPEVCGAVCKIEERGPEKSDATSSPTMPLKATENSQQTKKDANPTKYENDDTLSGEKCVNVIEEGTNIETLSAGGTTVMDTMQLDVVTPVSLDAPHQVAKGSKKGQHGEIEAAKLLVNMFV